MQRASLLLLAASLFISPVLPSRTKRQIFDPQGAEQDFPPPGFTPQQRPPFGRPGAFGPQGDAGFGSQRPPGFGAQRPPFGFGSQRPPAGFGPQGTFGSGGPPQDFDQFGPDGQQFIRPRPPYRPAPNNPYTLPGLDPLGGISKALESIARYDDKRCVARMLCEVAAGGSPGNGYRGTSGFFDFSGLRGIADLLGAMTNSEGASPMFMFGSAALLGASQRDPYRCYRSYPECPRDPDRLVDYLNNHNGGFFKLFNPQEPIQEEPTTRRPPYFRRGKKVRKQKYPPEGSSGFDENRPLSPSKDVPISGKPPILADTDYDDQSNYVTARPQRDIYTDPTRPYKKRKPVFFDQSAPSSNNPNNNFNNRPSSAPNRIVFDDNKIPQSYQTTAKPNHNIDYYTTPKPTYNYDLYATNRPQQYNTARPSVIRFDQSQYTTPRPNNNKNQYTNSRPFYEKYTTPRPNRGVVFQNSDQNDEYYVDDDATSGSVMFVTPIPLYSQPGNVYSNPSRVLWAQSSRPSKTSRNFNVVPQFKFPATNSRTNVHDTSTSLLFPTDRTGTGELRLDTEQLKASSAQLQHRELAESSRGGKSLNFPDSASTSSANKPSSSSGTVTFPNP